MIVGHCWSCPYKKKSCNPVEIINHLLYGNEKQNNLWWRLCVEGLSYILHSHTICSLGLFKWAHYNCLDYFAAAPDCFYWASWKTIKPRGSPSALLFSSTIWLHSRASESRAQAPTLLCAPGLAGGQPSQSRPPPCRLDLDWLWADPRGGPARKVNINRAPILGIPLPSINH